MKLGISILFKKTLKTSFHVTIKFWKTETGIIEKVQLHRSSSACLQLKVKNEQVNPGAS